MNTELKPYVTIENWIILGERIHGEIHGHSEYENGTAVVTSPIVRKGEAVIETVNTLYKMGKPFEMPDTMQPKKMLNSNDEIL